MSRSYLPVFAALLLSAALAVPAAADHSWGVYHWARQTTPFDLLVVDSVTEGAWQDALNESLSRWNVSSQLYNDVDSFADDSKTRKRCKMVQGQMRVCNAKYGQNGWLGMATINIDPEQHITQGTAKINDSYDWYFAKYRGHGQPRNVPGDRPCLRSRPHQHGRLNRWHLHGLFQGSQQPMAELARL